MHCYAVRVCLWLSKVRLVILTSCRRAEVPVRLSQVAAVTDTKPGHTPAPTDEQKASSKVCSTGSHAEKGDERLQSNAKLTMSVTMFSSGGLVWC